MTQCINCNGEDFIEVAIEELPCSHCGGTVKIDYVVCNTCGMIAKVVDGVVVSGALFDIQGLTGADTPDIAAIFEDSVITTFKIGVPEGHGGDDKNSSMFDLVHRCLKCNSVAFEKKANLWHCPDCGFEWETLEGV